MKRKDITISYKELLTIVRMAHHKSIPTLSEQKLLEKWGNRL